MKVYDSLELAENNAPAGESKHRLYCCTWTDGRQFYGWATASFALTNAVAFILGVTSRVVYREPGARNGAELITSNGHEPAKKKAGKAGAK